MKKTVSKRRADRGKNLLRGLVLACVFSAALGACVGGPAASGSRVKEKSAEAAAAEAAEAARQAVLAQAAAARAGVDTDGRMGKIAVLPFTGGSPDEREGIAELLSFTPQIMNNFRVIPRTTISNALKQEQRFQSTSGMTDSESIAALGKQLGAQFVLSGSITSLGKANLLIVSIIRIDAIQQVAGEYMTYATLDAFNDNESLLNDMAGTLITQMGKNTAKLTKLAVLPVQVSAGVNAQDGDTLAQLLSIYLIENGKYAVYPRTKTLAQVQKEYETQLSGDTSEEEAAELGHAVNPPYVLSITPRRIGSTNLFNAAIVAVEGGHTIIDGFQSYNSLSDGMNVMSKLAATLSGK